MGVNAIGLRRRGVDKASIDAIHKAIRILKSPKYNTTQAIEVIREEIKGNEYIDKMIEFIQTSKEGSVLNPTKNSTEPRMNLMNNFYEKYADVLVNYSTKVKKNDLVIIKAESYLAEPLIKEIYKLSIKNGAHPVVRCALEGLSEIFIKNATDEQLDFVDEISKLEYEKADKIISIGAPFNVKSMANTDSKKWQEGQKQQENYQRLCLKGLKKAN